MDLQRALKLKPGDLVACPPDRGGPGFAGRVAAGFTPGDIQRNHAGAAFIWAQLVSGGLWPSNRLKAAK